MLIRTLSLDDPAWNETLASTPHDVYHTPAYVRTEARRMQAEGEAVVVTDGDRQLFLPYLLRSGGMSLPDDCDSPRDIVSPYGYPGILLNEPGRNSQFAAEAWMALCEDWRQRGICSAFLRMHPILGAGFEELFPPGTLLDSGDTVAVNLYLDRETIWGQISKNHRRTLEKCRKLGFTTRFLPLRDVLDSFIDIYEQTMDRVGARDSYYFGRDYFSALADMPGVECCVVESGGVTIAACLLFESHGIVQFHLGGTATEFYSQSPFHFCLNQAILWSKERGNHWLHFGGGVGGSDDQLMKFKAGFSPLRFHFQTARVILNEPVYLQLVEATARSNGTSPGALLASNYFPAYRTPR